MTNHIGRGGRRRRAEQAVKGGATRLTAAQAPSSPAAEQGNGAGIIRPNTGALRLPRGLVDSGERPPSERPGWVMILITGLALIFIAIITWFVAQMPPK
jgi:hypothetical protein